jgi:hypothetical protein
MREVDALPLGIVIARGAGIIGGEVTEMEQPIRVQQGLLPRGWRGGGGADTVIIAVATRLGFRAGRERGCDNEGQSETQTTRPEIFAMHN